MRDWSSWIMSYCTAVSIVDAVLGRHTRHPSADPTQGCALQYISSLSSGALWWAGTAWQALRSHRQVQVASGLS